MSYLPLALAFWLLIAPIFPEPHLLEKLRWLKEGKSFKPIDWFDLAFHSMVPVALVAYAFRHQLGF